MSPTRIALYAIPLGVFAAAFIPWLQFLKTDDCLDLSGAVVEGVCESGSAEPIAFWQSNLWFKAFALLPPLLAALAVFAYLRFAFVREDVPPNKSLERTREG
jgi:hypothetical protein